MRAAREQGLSGLEVMQYTSSDADGQLGLIHSEEMHWGCAGIALAINGSGLAAAGVAASGTPEQIAEWVPQCLGVGDEIKLGAYAVTEPQAGSDVKSLRTTARRDGDEWVLNGTKVFITNGGIADVNVVVATVDPSSAIAGRPPSSSPRTPPACGGQEGEQARHPRLADGGGRLRGLPDPGRLPARRPRQARSQARARPFRREQRPRFERARDVRADPADRRRLGARDRAGSLRVDARVPRRRSSPTRSSRARRELDRRAAAARAAARPAGPRRRGDRDRRRAAARPARRPGWAATGSRWPAARARCRSSRPAM